MSSLTSSVFALEMRECLLETARPRGGAAHEVGHICVAVTCSPSPAPRAAARVQKKDGGEPKEVPIWGAGPAQEGFTRCWRLIRKPALVCHQAMQWPLWPWLLLFVSTRGPGRVTQHLQQHMALLTQAARACVRPGGGGTGRIDSDR